MKLKFSILLISLVASSIAQTTYKKGILKKTNGESKTVYIQAFDNVFIPETINFKDNLKTNSFKTVKASFLEYIEVFGVLKYQRRIVPIEILQDNMLAKANNNIAKFNTKDKSLFLKVLLESNELILYAYLDKETKNQFFFIEDKNEINLLKYKRINKDHKILKIKKYRQEIFRDYKLEGFKFARLNYSKEDLINYFKKYLKTSNRNYIEYKKFSRATKDAINLNVSSGYSLISQKISNGSPNFDTTSSINLINFGMGIEYFINSNFKNYSIIFDAKYFLKGNNEEDFLYSTLNNINVDSKIVNELSLFTFNLRLRKYWKLKNNDYIFGNIGVGIHQNSSNIKYVYKTNNRTFVDLKYNNKIHTQPFHFLLGVGYNYQNFLFGLDYAFLMGKLDSFNFRATTLDWTVNRRNILNLSLSYSLF